MCARLSRAAPRMTATLPEIAMRCRSRRAPACRFFAARAIAPPAIWARISRTRDFTIPGLPGATRFSDTGRFLVTKRDRDQGAFKTPTLRQVAARPPYMHDGSIASLEEVVEYYDRGGNRNPNLDSELQPIGFTGEEKRALVAFLRSLSGVVREGM